MAGRDAISGTPAGTPALAPVLLVLGTGSDAGKTTVVAGLCRLLARRGVRVAPFKAQNMSLNSAVTADGGEIGRAQALQALAAGVEPETAMNPVLLKPTGERRSQVVVHGRPWQEADAVGYGDLAARLRPIVLAALADLRGRFDVVIAEGAGSASEINLRDRDLVNTGLARDADVPWILVGDIERGGVFASLYGTWALLDPAERHRLTGFVINRFRGDPSLLDAGLDELAARTGVPVLGVLPWLPDLRLDAEDGLGIADLDGGPPLGRDGLDVAVVRWPHVSNATDVDALAGEPGVSVAFTASPGLLRRADLVVLPGTKATVADLAWLRARGLDRVLLERVAAGRPVLGICGGMQVLGRWIDDEVESGAGRVEGLGVLPHTTTFAPDKLVRRTAAPVLAGAGIPDVPPEGVPAEGYEIRHGRLDPDDVPVVVDAAVMATAWHGLLEGDAARAAVLRWAATHAGRAFTPAAAPGGSTAPAPMRRRLAELDRLADAIAAHLDVDALLGPAARPR